jgi:hypothetical protein
VPSGFSNTEILIVHVHVYEYAYVGEGQCVSKPPLKLFA